MQGLKRAAEALQEGAQRYRREHGRPFVLVIDNIDRLAAHEPRVSQSCSALITCTVMCPATIGSACKTRSNMHRDAVQTAHVTM